MTAIRFALLLAAAVVASPMQQPRYVGTIVGCVIDGRTGKPIDPAAQVDARYNESGERASMAYSDVKGRFLVRLPDRDGETAVFLRFTRNEDDEPCKVIPLVALRKDTDLGDVILP